LVVKLDKQVSTEHGFGHGLHTLVTQLLHLHRREKAGEPLILEIL
jgi:hypothetical protein